MLPGDSMSPAANTQLVFVTSQVRGYCRSLVAGKRVAHLFYQDRNVRKGTHVSLVIASGESQIRR